MKTFTQYTFALLLLVSFLTICSSAVAGEQESGFTNPEITQEMGKEWIDKNLEYLPADVNNDLVVTLNQQFMQLAPYIQEFAGKHNIKIIINEGTCGISAGKISKKQVDIGGFCCPPGKTDRLPGIKFHTIGIHPVSIIVNKSNPVNEITMGQVRDIFKGNIVYWSDVGGEKIPILPVARLHCKKRPGHWRLILDNEDLFSPGIRTVGAVEDMFTFVSTNPDSIGHEVLWMSKKYEDIKALHVDSMNPENLDHLLQNKYPVYRALYLTSWEDKNKNPLAEELIQFVQSKIDEHGREIGMIPASELRKAGWKFKDQELIGPPPSL